jgi:type IX secretion system PorP/SprF family membrane protein
LLFAQPLVKHNLYPFNADYANPAATGLSNCLVINATDMHQWIGISNAPNVQSLSIQKGIPFRNYKKSGIGLNLIRDSNGPTKIMNGEFLYSFQSAINKTNNTRLSLGLSVEVQQGSIDESSFSPVFDPEIAGNTNKEISYNASAGAYVFNDHTFAGIAVYNLLPIRNNIGIGYGGDAFFLSLQGGHLFSFEKKHLSLLSSVQGFAGKKNYQLDFNNRLTFRNDVWAGLTIRKYLGQFETSGQNVLVFLGYDFSNWSICYNYIFDINGTQFHHYGTHLLSLGYRICNKTIACPAYR